MGKRPPREPPKGNSPSRDDLQKIFGQNLRAVRIKAGLTQAQLADRTGLTQQYVSLVEAGQARHDGCSRESGRARRECAALERTLPYQAEIVPALP